MINSRILSMNMGPLLMSVTALFMSKTPLLISMTLLLMSMNALLMNMTFLLISMRALFMNMTLLLISMSASFMNMTLLLMSMSALLMNMTLSLMNKLPVLPTGIRGIPAGRRDLPARVGLLESCADTPIAFGRTPSFSPAGSAGHVFTCRPSRGGCPVVLCCSFCGGGCCARRSIRIRAMDKVFVQRSWWWC